MALDPTIIALVGTLFGGVGLKLAEWWLARNRVKIDDAMEIRSELRSEVNALRAENSALEKDVDRWRNAYYDLRDVVARLKTFIVVHGLDPPPDE